MKLKRKFQIMTFILQRNKKRILLNLSLLKSLGVVFVKSLHKPCHVDSRLYLVRFDKYIVNLQFQCLCSFFVCSKYSTNSVSKSGLIWIYVLLRKACLLFNSYFFNTKTVYFYLFISIHSKYLNRSNFYQYVY